MSDVEENGTKGNTGDFAFPKSSNGVGGGNRTSSSPKKKRVRPLTNPNNDGGAKIIIALLAGAGAAFLLALMLLMSRLESQEFENGLLNSNVGGAKGVDDVLMYEEAQGKHYQRQQQILQQQQSAAERQSKLLEKIQMTKRMNEFKMKKLDKLVGGAANPLDAVMKEANEELEGMEEVLEGKRKVVPNRKKVDLQQQFHDMLQKGEDEKKKRKAARKKELGIVDDNHFVAVSDAANEDDAPHLKPHFPPLPPHTMSVDLFGEQIITDTLSHNKPTMAGIIAILQRFLQNLHQFLIDHRDSKALTVINEYFDLVTKYLVPLEEAYRDKPVFPIREDESIFMSLGAYRDHLLGETLRQAFKNAANPDKLFVGAVVQNCFGIDVTCRTGVEVKGKDERGNPITKVSDRGPDVNGIEQFCDDPEYTKYCDSGQIRALYVNETESNGPTTARYFASKLWGGETYFLQADAHLRFAPEWDRLYAEEVKAAKSYPKAVLSAYPPGFSEGDPPYQGGTTGTRLCTCVFSDSDVEHHIIRINTGEVCGEHANAPTQIAYIAAGFFFARAEFLTDVPFDPFLPWCFMGEEIALSLRAWTHGWDIYAPRKNLIAHQYRPGRMGLPKFWENTGRVFGRPGPGFNTQLQTISLKRVKYMVGYKDTTKEGLENLGHSVVLTDFQHYGPGETRTMDEFLKHVNIDIEQQRCGNIEWCNKCLLD
jgi:[Skp1-protein]-hydroxyproline N-acetylglucosaminyltransferase